MVEGLERNDGVDGVPGNIDNVDVFWEEGAWWQDELAHASARKFFGCVEGDELSSRDEASGVGMVQLGHCILLSGWNCD
tara:strand:+ start:2591 stop:2827 length:237 start_codon:yes stop_codon:yes gene_type:complete